MVNLTQAIQDCQSGYSESFGIIYDQFVKKIYNYLYFRTGHRETAEDLTSVTFTKALQNIKTFNVGQATFSAWIYRIARNTLIDYYRTNKVTFDITEVVDIKSRTNLETEFDVSKKLSDVIDYLNNLPSEQRDLLVMRIWDGLSYKEIAEVTGKTEASLKVAVSRLLTKLKAQQLVILLLILTT